MILIKLEDGGLYTWYWKSGKGKVISPKFDTEELATNWYRLHETWMEDPTIEDSDEENTAYDG